MGNMSYCRFENTLQDLKDCSEHISDDITARENIQREKLIALCAKIANEYGRPMK